LNNTIEHLVAALPEKYQPIFGHPEISDNFSRACDDRLALVRETYEALQALHGRPLRVLDLGCAQGYFSLNLAAAGADVVGIDYLPANVAVCEALANECPDLKAKFHVGRIEDVIDKIQPSEFDLVLGFSVFHHVIHEKGALAVKDLLNTAVERVGCLLLEMALKSEPLYWAASQPNDPRDLFVDMVFVHQLALHPTHLADIQRPMFVASNRFWVLDGQAQQIVDWSIEPHGFAPAVHQGGRRYYKSKSRFLKWYRIDQSHWHYNRESFKREVEFLEKVPSGFSAPEIISHGSNAAEAWLVMERVEGELLSDVLLRGGEIDIPRLLSEVLAQVCLLEAEGWYHNDIRVWNTIIQDHGAVILIDYESILRTPQDCVWPNNIFLAFLIFIYEVVTRHIEPPLPLRAVAISPGRFPAPYNALVRRLWNVPAAQWSFSLFRKFFDEMEQSVEVNIQPVELWSTAIESAMQALSLNQYHLGLKTQQAEARAQQAEADAQQAEARAQQAEADAQQAEARAQQAESLAQQAAAALNAIHNSRSWHVTRPLRWSFLQARLLRAHGAKARVKAAVRKAAVPMLRKAVGFVSARPRLRQQMVVLSKRTGTYGGIKGFYHRLQRVAGGPLTKPSDDQSLPLPLRQLTPRARKIYTDIQVAMEKNKGAV